MIRSAQKWDFKSKEYKDYVLPLKASLLENDMDSIVECAECGEELFYGLTFTSRSIHNVMGLGYGVCEKCYEIEWVLDLYYREKNDEQED